MGQPILREEDIEDFAKFFTPERKQEILRQITECYDDYMESDKHRAKFEFIAISITLASIGLLYTLF